MGEKVGILQQSRAKIMGIVRDHGLDQVRVVVRVKALTPEEAIGRPGRRDFPIVEGKNGWSKLRFLDSGRMLSRTLQGNSSADWRRPWGCPSIPTGIAPSMSPP